jgi:C4-dicarboxylate-specific signal transduction histidine kinase
VASNTIAAEQVDRLFHAAMGDPEIARVVPGDVTGRWDGYMRRALGGERFVVEESLPGDDGLRRYQVALNPTIQHGQVTGVAVFSRDVTELHRAEEQARQHQAELAHALRLHTVGEMAASLAHEVNQPLGAIANYAQGCRRRIESGAITAQELLPMIEAIAREAMRAGEITRRVRTVLRKEDSPRHAVDMAALLEAAVGLALPTARRLGVTLTCLPTPPLPRVVGDPIQIEQVLLNLLLNAVEASSQSPQPAHVEVRMQATDPGQLEVAVADNGAGVDPALGDGIFEPFRTTKPGGLGMGLAISRSIVASHGGRLWVTDNPTGGAVFRVTLPAGAAPDGAVPSGEAP